MWTQLFVVFLVALVGAFAVSFGYRRHRPWSFWTLLGILFLVGLAVSLWVQPVGPLVYGFAWLPVVMGTLIIVFLMLALGGSPPETRGDTEPYQRVEGAASIFIWFLIAALGISVLAAFLRPGL